MESDSKWQTRCHFIGWGMVGKLQASLAETLSMERWPAILSKLRIFQRFTVCCDKIHNQCDRVAKYREKTLCGQLGHVRIIWSLAIVVSLEHNVLGQQNLKATFTAIIACSDTQQHYICLKQCNFCSIRLPADVFRLPDSVWMQHKEHHTLNIIRDLVSSGRMHDLVRWHHFSLLVKVVAL